jgi:hypothetical protein
MAFDMIERAPRRRGGGWFALRFLGLTILLAGALFWATLILLA